MSQLQWTNEKLLSLGKLFLIEVHGNMRHDQSTVRFGLTGTGSNPNYQIEHLNKMPLAYGGLSHEQDPRTDIFDQKRISQAFTREEIRIAMEKAPSAADRR